MNWASGADINRLIPESEPLPPPPLLLCFLIIGKFKCQERSENMKWPGGTPGPPYTRGIFITPLPSRSLSGLLSSLFQMTMAAWQQFCKTQGFFPPFSYIKHFWKDSLCFTNFSLEYHWAPSPQLWRLLCSTLGRIGTWPHICPRCSLWERNTNSSAHSPWNHL